MSEAGTTSVSNFIGLLLISLNLGYYTSYWVCMYLICRKKVFRDLRSEGGQWEENHMLIACPKWCDRSVIITCTVLYCTVPYLYLRRVWSWDQPYLTLLFTWYRLSEVMKGILMDCSCFPWYWVTIGTHDSGIPCILPICGIIARRRSGAKTSRSRDFDTGAVRYRQWGIP